MKRVNSELNPDDFVDKISTLPDSILSLILSFIPTKNAVATSILSKRWISLWKAVINLDFKLDFCKEHCMKNHHWDCSEGWSADEDMKFASFVNHVLLLHDGGFLNKFRLVWKPMCIPSQVYSWISTAISKTVHELFLYLENSDLIIDILSSVFTCGTLQSLELNGDVFVSDETVVFLPRLRRLKLVSVYFQSEQALQTLISGCPMLNCLDIQMEIDEMMEYYQLDPGTHNINVFTFRISSTSVTILKLSVKSDSYADRYDEIPHCSLELKTSSLEFLKLVGLVSRIFVQETLSSLVGADLDIEMSNFDFSEASVSNSLVEAVRALNFAVGLTLSRYALWALSHATISLSTKFKRLIQLEVEADCCICSSLQDFIQSSDNLEILAIIKVPLCENDDRHLNRNHLNWATPAEVPICLSNKLERVIFYDYSGFSYEYEMIGYMLEHGRALKAIQVFCERGKADIKYELLQDISEFPRKSPACKVYFSGHLIIPPSLENFPKSLLM